MPINAREMFLIIRAKDEASRVLRGLSATMLATGAAADKSTREATARANHMIQMGSALASVGAGALIAGAGVEAALFGAGKAAIEYNRQAALTATQTDGVANALNKVSKIGKRVGADIGVPFDELQASLFDIFSSMDVSVPQAEKLLRGFSKASVAGQANLQSAGRATIALMNSFDIPISKVNDVLDFQFRLVQKGVGSYDEFSKTIGRSIPSAVRAGQTYQTLGGMLAFLTRNGLSTAMASASAARAFDAMSHPKTVKKMKDIGVSIKDANGEFRPMVDVMKDLQKQLDGLTRPERAKALYNIFKGSGGTIQARRFFDAVLKDRGAVKELAGYTNDMANSSGVLERKYKTMAETLAVKAELLSNRWQIIKISVGEQLMPVLEKLVEALGKMITWWNKLDDSTKKNIVTWTAISGIVLIVFGALSILSGGIIMITGALGLMGISAGVVFGNFTLLAGVIGLLVYGFKSGNDTALMLGAALTGLLVAKALAPMFSSLRGSVGNAKAGMDLFANSAQYGVKKTDLLKSSIGGGFDKAVGSMKGALKSGVSMLGGPWGIALMAGGILLANYFNKQRQAAQRVQEHTDALNKQTGALTDNNRQIAIKALQDSGAMGAARTLGLSLKDVTDAALGNAGAIKRVNNQMDTAVSKYADMRQGGRGVSGALANTSSAIDKVSDAIHGSNGEISKARQKWIDMTEAMGNAGGKAETTGYQIGQGLASGLANSRHLALAEARNTINRVNAMMRATAEVQSPSKMTERIGKFLTEGLVLGMLGGADKVTNAAERLIERITKVYEDADKKVDKGLIKIINTHKKRLAELGTILDNKKADFTSLYTGIMSTGSLGGLGKRTKDVTDAEGNTTSVDVAPTSSSIIEDVRARVIATQKFDEGLKELKRLGLNPTSLAALANDGVDAAGEQVIALAATGKSAIDEINKLETQLSLSGQSIARTGSNAMFAAGQASAMAIATGFRSQKNVILAEMRTVARDMVNELQTELGLEVTKWYAGPGKDGKKGTKDDKYTVVQIVLDKKVLAEAVATQRQSDNRRNG